MENLKKALGKRGIELVHVQVGKSAKSKLAKALEERLDNDELRKARVTKYIRREGTKGNYKYVYKEPKAKVGMKGLKGEKPTQNVSTPLKRKEQSPKAKASHGKRYPDSYMLRDRDKRQAEEEWVAGAFKDKPFKFTKDQIMKMKRKEMLDFLKKKGYKSSDFQGEPINEVREALAVESHIETTEGMWDKEQKATFPDELKKCYDKMSKNDKKEFKEALANGWKPKSLKEYQKEAIEGEIEMYGSGDFDKEYAQDLMIADADKLDAMSDKEIKKKYEDEIGMEEGEDISVEDMKEELSEFVEGSYDMYLDEANESSGREMFDFYHDSDEEFLKENMGSVADAITNDLFDFQTEHKEKKQTEKFHQKNPHAKEFLEHSGHSMKDYKPEQLEAINKYIGKIKSGSSKKK